MSVSGWSRPAKPISYDGVSIDGPPPLEDGVHFGECVDAEAVESKNGNSGVKGKVILSRSIDGDTEPYGEKGRVVYFNVAFTDKTVGMVLRAAKAFDVDPPKDDSYDEVRAFAESMVGKPIYMKTKQEEYKGKLNSKFDRFITAEEAEKMQEEAGAGAKSEAVPARRKAG